VHEDVVTVASGELLSMVLDLTTDAALLSDGDGVIVHVNTPLLRLFGYQSGTLVGQHVDVLMLPDCDDTDVEGRRADGTTFPIDVHLNVPAGSPLVVATVRDMTAERQSSVDGAIARIDLANAISRIDQLQESLDLVIQQLFGLGTSIVASASNDSALSQRLDDAVRGIDQVIDAVQQRRRDLRS
jgi:PAS domain-containing protein